MYFDPSFLRRGQLIYKTSLVEVFAAGYLNSQVCCKCIKITAIGTDKAEQEVTALQLLNHPNVVKYFWSGPYQEDDFLIVQELLVNDLEKEIDMRVKNRTQWSEQEIFSHLICMIDVLSQMQENGYSHRDIKPQNILVDAQGNLKLADFGNARSVATDNTLTIAGTPLYLSPELKVAYKNFHIGANDGSLHHDPFKSDVYSLGLTFLYMASLKKILPTQDQNYIPQRVAELPMRNIREYLYCMLQEDSRNRPDFLILKNSLIQNGLIRNVQDFINQYASLFRNKCMLQNPPNSVKYQVFVRIEAITQRINEYIRFFYQNKNCAEELKNNFKLLCKYAQMDYGMWKIDIGCEGCCYGIPDFYCNECIRGYHADCALMETVDDIYEVKAIYKCKKCSAFLFERKISEKCCMCGERLEKAICNKECGHLFCDRCSKNQLPDKKNRMYCPMCPIQIA